MESSLYANCVEPLSIADNTSPHEAGTASRKNMSASGIPTEAEGELPPVLVSTRLSTSVQISFGTDSGARSNSFKTFSGDAGVWVVLEFCRSELFELVDDEAEDDDEDEDVSLSTTGGGGGRISTIGVL